MNVTTLPRDIRDYLLQVVVVMIIVDKYELEWVRSWLIGMDVTECPVSISIVTRTDQKISSVVLDDSKRSRLQDSRNIDW